MFLLFCVYTADQKREAEILRTLGLQGRVPPFDPLSVGTHDFTDQSDDEDESTGFGMAVPGPFHSAVEAPSGVISGHNGEDSDSLL